MNEKMIKAFDTLIARAELSDGGDTLPFSRESGDHSRTFRDSAVVLAFEIMKGIVKAYFYSTDTNSVTSHINRIGNAEHTHFHSHNFLEIAYVIENPLKLIINDTISEFQPGDICIMDYSTLHAEKLEEKSVKILYFSLAPELFDEIINSDKNASFSQKYLKSVILEKRNSCQYVHFVPNSDAVESTASVLAILNETVDQKAGASNIIRGHIIRLLSLLTTEYTPRLSGSEKAQLRRNLYRDVCAYIKHHLRDVTVNDLITHFHYNPDFFNRLIKEFSGMTYTEYLQSERLVYAEKLLLDRKLSVSDIANEVGYQNIGYFYKIFRKKYGMLPSEYRKKAVGKK